MKRRIDERTLCRALTNEADRAVDGHRRFNRSDIAVITERMERLEEKDRGTDGRTGPRHRTGRSVTGQRGIGGDRRSRGGTARRLRSARDRIRSGMVAAAMILMLSVPIVKEAVAPTVTPLEIAIGVVVKALPSDEMEKQILMVVRATATYYRLQGRNE